MIFTEENHIELSDILKNIKGKMRELYKGYNFYKYS